MPPLWLFPGYGYCFGCAAPWPFAVCSPGQPQTSSGTVTPPAHIYRPMCRGTSAAIFCPHGILLCRFWEPTWQHFNLANNLTPIWFTSPPQPYNRVKGFHVQRLDNRCFNPPDAPISCCPWCWFRLSVYRLRSSVTRSQDFLSFKTGNHSTPNPTGVRLNQVIPRAGPLPCVSVTSSYRPSPSRDPAYPLSSCSPDP